jgi:hypothetical protein
MGNLPGGVAARIDWEAVFGGRELRRAADAEGDAAYTPPRRYRIGMRCLRV